MNATARRTISATAAILSLSAGACSGATGDEVVNASSVVEPATIEPASATAQAPGRKCLPHIESTGDWLAADGGRTIPLSNGTSIHLFGDTLLDASTPEQPGATYMVGNSIGLATCADGGYSIDYIWREQDGTRGAFFDMGVEGVRLWPVDGFELGGRAYVLLGKIVETTEGLGFDCIGTTWATIENPLDAPRDWRITYQDFTGKEGFRPDKGITVKDGYVYLYSSLVGDQYPSPVDLLRIPQTGLDAPAAHLEFLTDSGDWRPTSSFAGDARAIVEESSTTMYVHYHAGLGRFVTIHADSVFGSPNMVVQTAPALEGPWSEAAPIYQFPEKLEPRPDGSTVNCYAGTEHPQLRMNDGNTLVVTYACNTLGGPVPSLDNLEIYFPKTVTIDLDQVKEAMGGVDAR
jgi:hypothetical protein